MEIKDRILASAGKLFKKYSIKRITMDDIARDLAVSKKTLYQHFAQKEDLIFAFLNQELKSCTGQFQKIYDSNNDSVHEIIEAMKLMGAIISEFNPLFFDDLQRFYPHSWSLFSKFREEQILSMIVKNLSKGIQEGFYRKEINPNIMARLRIEEVNLGLRSDLFAPAQYSVVEIQKELLLHFLYGIANIKGHQRINELLNIRNNSINPIT